ncbi:MAG: peptidase [Proteobacteria bacterium]|nr:peptidase [Pseudomonadota bacterium]
MPDNNIDYKFLSDLEGGCETVGDVPAAQVSKSGVTIATGFDLGQRSEADLNKIGLPVSLVIKLKPYLGKKAQEAANYLKTSPLKITLEEGKSIDKAVKSEHVSSLKTKYFASPHNTAKKDFFALPAEAQTVIASVSFQYSINLEMATPKFWKAAASQDWKEAVKIMVNFGDAYPTRRKKEAALLEKIVQ